MGQLLIIPAGGDQTRWGRTQSKHLSVVDGETLLDRLYRQFSPGREVALLARAEDILASWQVPDVLEVCGGPCLAVSLLDTLADRWHQDVLVVHGDVWLTEAAARFIAQEVVEEHDTLQPLFFGTDMEIFACYWRSEVWVTAKKALGRSFLDHKVGVGRGQLWAMYRALRRVDLRVHDIYRVRSDPYYFGIKDGSTDFDAFDQYEAFIDRGGGVADGRE